MDAILLLVGIIIEFFYIFLRINDILTQKRGGRTCHRLLANALTLVKELRPGACRALLQQKKSDKNRTSLLRRQDSNMRPPGYEPGELPTAPLRDITMISQCFSRNRLQRYDYFLK